VLKDLVEKVSLLINDGLDSGWKNAEPDGKISNTPALTLNYYSILN
jgi:hypothetical protein